MENEKRLIDANAFEKSIQLSIASWGRDCNSNAPVIVRTYKDVLSRIGYAPTVDAVEVVRCKDCKHCTVTSDGMVCENALPTKRMMDYYIYGSTILAKVEANDFCSRGERRTVSEDGK